ncbi:MAG: hypothetical protein AAF411_19405 [Myxococcota bacterium]
MEPEIIAERVFPVDGSAQTVAFKVGRPALARGEGPEFECSVFVYDRWFKLYGEDSVQVLQLAMQFGQRLLGDPESSYAQGLSLPDHVGLALWPTDEGGEPLFVGRHDLQRDHDGAGAP